MDDVSEEGSLSDIEAEILKFLGQNSHAAYNTLDSWALVARARSNDGDGDVVYGGLFMPPGTDMFTIAGLRWLFDEGIANRFGPE